MVAKRRALSLCPECGKPLDREGYNCRSCCDRHNERNKLDRIYYQSNGVCPRCRKNQILGEEKACPECNAKLYARIMQNRSKEEYNKSHAEWSKRTHHEMIDKGICTRCRKRKADNGYKTCGICREKTRNYKRKDAKPNRRDRYKDGLCYFCDNPVKVGYKLCEYHYQRNVENARGNKAREARVELVKRGVLW